MNTQRLPLRRQRGVSLVEVLIAVLIFSLGLMGLGGLLIFAIQSNHVAYLRTQVGFLAHNMADRMSANPIGVWSGSYNLAYPQTGTVDCSTGCNPTDLAAYDWQIFTSQLRTFLPNDGNLAAEIDCNNSAAAFVPQGAQLALRPPYGGKCTMNITWSENGTGDKGANQAQTFTWIFQP
jgi:type IV pilus assembly protein PilV